MNKIQKCIILIIIYLVLAFFLSEFLLEGYNILDQYVQIFALLGVLISAFFLFSDKGTKK